MKETATNMKSKNVQSYIDHLDPMTINNDLKTTTFISQETQIFIGYIIAILIMFGFGVWFQNKNLTTSYSEFEAGNEAGEEMIDIIRKEIAVSRYHDLKEIKDLKDKMAIQSTVFS